MTLAADTNLDVAAADASQVRVDLIIAEIQDVGTSSSLGQFRVLQGTLGAGRPALPTTPSTTHCISLATITLPAGGGATIQAAWITLTQSDTWVKTDSDATWTCAPGGTVLVDFASPSSLFQMSATRRQGFAALFAPGTRFVDTVNRVEGYMDGTDIVPTSTRMLYNGYDAGDSASMTFGVSLDLLVPGALTLIGGTRRIRVDATAIMRATTYTTGPIGARLTVSGMTGNTIAGYIGTQDIPGTISLMKSWSLTASGTISSGTWKLSGLFNSGSGVVKASQMSLIITDEGPA